MSEMALWDFSFHVEYSDNDIWKHPIANAHFHKVYEIYYLLENEIAYFIDDKTYHIKEGTVVIVPPFHIHSTRCLNEKTRKRILIYIPEKFIEDYLKDEPDLLKRLGNIPLPLKPARRKAFETLLFKLLTEYQTKSPSPVLQKALLGEFLVSLWRYMNESKKEEDTANTVHKSSEQMQRITNYVTSHYYQDLSLESLSKMFFLHPTYISRAFKKQLNISFVDYLKSVRIREAMLLLQSSEFSIVEIATKVGFVSSTSFCRAFKAVMGTTPLQYRKSYHSDLTQTDRQS